MVAVRKQKNSTIVFLQKNDYFCVEIGDIMSLTKQVIAMYQIEISK